MKRIIFLFLTAIIILSSSVITFAHSGRTDSNGGHWNHSTGSYHYHHGNSAHDHYDIDGDGQIDCPYNYYSSKILIYIPLFLIALVLLWFIFSYLAIIIKNIKTVRSYLRMSEQDVFTIVLEDIKAKNITCYNYIKDMKTINPIAYKYYSKLAKKNNKSIFDLVLLSHRNYLNRYSEIASADRLTILNFYTKCRSDLQNIINSIYEFDDEDLKSILEYEASSYLFFVFDTIFYKYSIYTNAITNDIYSPLYVDLNIVNKYASFHYDTNNIVCMLPYGSLVYKSHKNITPYLFSNIIFSIANRITTDNHTSFDDVIIANCTKKQKEQYNLCVGQVYSILKNITTLSKELENHVIEYYNEYKYFMYDAQPIYYRHEPINDSDEEKPLAKLDWYRTKHLKFYKPELKNSSRRMSCSKHLSRASSKSGN